MKKIWIALGLVAFLTISTPREPKAQRLEKALITHQSESIGITPLIYGIEKGYYRTEGIDLEFRILRSDLAVAAIIGSREIDYMYGAGTAIRAAVKGLPLKILSHDIKTVLHYLMTQPNIQLAKDLKGKKIAVGSLGGTNLAAAKASIKVLGLDPEKDVTYIVIGAASIRMAAMETGSIQASMMPVPWNIKMRQKGFKELIFAGKVIFDPLNGFVTSKEKLEKDPEQVRKVLRGFLHSLKGLRQEKEKAIEFIARKFNLDPNAAPEVYAVLLETLTEDGTLSQQVLHDYLEQLKKEGGVKREIAVTDIVDYRMLKEVAKELNKQ